MKSKPLFQNAIFVKKSSTHGFGVFAGKTIRKGQKIEECYTIFSRRGGNRQLEDYYFDADGKYALLMGFGSIYNHSDDCNADYKINQKTRVTTLTAERTIKKGEEIFVSYGEEWFSSRNMKPKNAANKSKKPKKRKK